MDHYLRKLILGLVLISTIATAQVHEGSILFYDYATGVGNWQPYANIVREYNHAYPWLTDTAVFNEGSYGLSGGFGASGDRKFFLVRISGFKNACVSHGFAPTGSDWFETFVAKCEYTTMTAGFDYIYAEWFRMGIAAGISVGEAKLKSTRAFNPSQRVQAGKDIILLPGSEFTRYGKNVTAAAEISLPISIGRKFVFQIDPFYNAALLKVNLKDVRRRLIPNSTAALAEEFYKGRLSYYGVRFSIGFKVNI